MMYPKFSASILNFFTICLSFFSIISSGIYAQDRLSVALIAPEMNFQVEGIRNRLSAQLEKSFHISDSEMSDRLYASSEFSRPYNLTLEDAIGFGNRSGANYFVLLRSTLLKRTAENRKPIYESFLSAHVVSTRTGKLKAWVYRNFDSDDPIKSSKLLDGEIESAAAEIVNAVRKSEKEETEDEKGGFVPSEIPEKSPLPYSRVRPEYTKEAARYRVEATIDVIVEINESGKVERIDYLRWAGYGLEQAVEQAIRGVNWRAGSSGDRFLRSKVMLRYNFADLKSDN